MELTMLACRTNPMITGNDAQVGSQMEDNVDVEDGESRESRTHH